MFWRTRSCARADDAKLCAVGVRNAKPGNHLKSLPHCSSTCLYGFNEPNNVIEVHVI